MKIHTMAVLWGCVFMCLTSVLTFGLTISDDFVDNTQADWWDTLFFDPDHAWLEETSGRLELLSDGTVDSAAFYTGEQWMLDSSQNFSMKVSYYHSLTTFNYTDVMIVLGPGVLSSDDHLQFSASSYENNKEFYVELMDSGTQLVDESFGSTSTYGTLYVSYDAGLDELYLSSTGYGSANSEKTISGIIGGNWSGSPLLVGLGGSVDNYAVASGQLYLDDFVMEEGTIIQSGMTGLGTETAPYVIDSLADFDQFAGYSKYWNDYVRLETDIDLSGRTYARAVIAPDTDNSTSGFQGEYYRGVFDGNGHVINHMTIDTGMLDNWFLGLFGITDSGAEIMNLGLENVSVTGGSGSAFTGGLCAFPISCPVNDCYVTGTISGGSSTGGLLGCLLASIERCYSLCTVSGSDQVGGLVGDTTSFSDHNISYCFASGTVVGTGDSVGGLVGNANKVKYTDCSALGSVTGHENVAGLIGKTNGNSSSNYLKNCYAACQVTGTGSNNIGGFVGYNDSPINNCFWDTTVSGTTDGDGSDDPDPAGLIGLDTTGMQTRSTYTDVGWDFDAETDNGTDDIWHMPYSSTGYPMLWYQSETITGRFFWQVLKSDFPSFGLGYGLTIRVIIPEAINSELKGPDMADYTAAVWDNGLKNWKWEVLYMTLSELQQTSLGTWQLKLIYPDASETVYEFTISGGLNENEFLPIPIIQQPAHTTSNVIAEHYMFTWQPGGDQSAADDMYVEIGGDTFNYFSSAIDLSATQWYPGWLELGSAYCKVGYVDYRNDLITAPSLISGQEVIWDVFFASLVSGDKNYFYVKYSLDLMKDGKIDMSDLALFCSHWMEPLPSEANFDDTGYVGLEDFSIFAQHWQENASDLSGEN